MHKILILKFSALGDVVHTLPVAATLRKSLPDSNISWMVEERFQDILQGNPDIDEVIPLRTKVWRKNWNAKSLGDILGTIKKQGAKRCLQHNKRQHPLQCQTANNGAPINRFPAVA